MTKYKETVAIEIDNILLFLGGDKPGVTRAKDILNLKQCGATKACMRNAKSNPYSCDCFQKCEPLKKILELFI